MLESRPTRMYNFLHDGLVVIVRLPSIVIDASAQAAISVFDSFLSEPQLVRTEVSHGL